MFGCCFFGHDWEQTTETMYVQHPGQFTNEAHAYSGARCRRCGKVGLHRMSGTHSWWASKEITWEQALEKARGVTP